jgi:hypothetical protein
MKAQAVLGGSGCAISNWQKIGLPLGAEIGLVWVKLDGLFFFNLEQLTRLGHRGNPYASIGLNF